MDPVKERVIQHLKLAQVIAHKYYNIACSSREEILSEAQTALVKASMAYKEDKGPFAPFAIVVIRNALNSFFKKQLRNAKMEGKSLDETIHGATKFGTYIGNLGQNIADTRCNVLQDVKKREGSTQLKAVIKVLSEKEKLIVSCIGKGMSLGEIGKRLGVSKQAVFKVWCQARNKIKILLNNQAHTDLIKTNKQK